MTHLQHTLTQPPALPPFSLPPIQDASALKGAPPVLTAAPANDATAPDELDNPAALKKAFAERCNWETLTAKLRTVIETLHTAFPDDTASDQQNLMEAQLAAHLNSTSVPVCEGSSYYQKHNLAPTSVVKLGTFLNGSGLPVPKTLDALLALYQVATRHLQTLPLGNFSGALSWPIPLSTQDKQAILDLLNAPDPALPDLPLTDKTSVLGYLLSACSLSANDFKFTSSAVETLLGSAKAQALGQAIQTRLGGIATNTSVNDYLLAAIHLGLNPDSMGSPARNRVGGFDLGQRQYWNQPASVVIEGLGHHLVKEGRASAASADLAALMLLARSAPEYLVKDIPPTVTYGSVPWTQLAIAAAKLEVESPGRVLTMSYREVLAAADTTDVGASLAQHIQREALHNWGVVNGHLAADTTPTAAQMRTVQNAFIAQQEALQATTLALATPIPMREDMGMELLRTKFPGVADEVFRAKNLTKAWLLPGRPGRFPGTYSMLDVVMHGDKVRNDDLEHWVTRDKRIPIIEFCTLSDSGALSVADTFTQRYTPAIAALEKGHAGMTQHLISSLPPEDRKNFEYGKLEFFHTDDYLIGLDLSTKTLTQKGHTLDVKITREGQVNIYRIDTRAGTVSKHNYLAHIYSPPYTRLDSRDDNTLHRTVRFNPFEDEHTAHAKELPATAETPQVFDSERTRYIAKVLTKRLDLHGDDLLEHARGTTAYDTSRAADKAIGEFFLNMIPFRSAIINFTQGHIGDGLLDLGLDVIGLVTLGAGKAAHASKLLAKGVTGLKGAARTARFMGTVAIEALNPLGGAGDVLKGISRWAWSKGTKAFNALRGASGSYDLLKTASTQHGLAAMGTSKVAGHDLEMGAVFRGGNWHAFDAAKGVPYGAPLKNFQPTVAAANGEVKVLTTKPILREYEAVVSPELLQVKGLQGNVYIGPNNKEYIKVDGKLYPSSVKDGQRVIQHPGGARDDIVVRDLGSAGWEPSASANRLLGGNSLTPWKLNENTYVVPVDDVKINSGPSYPYTINYRGMNYVTTFDPKTGAWMAGSGNANGINTQYFWRTAKNKWQMGPLDELKKAPKIPEHNFRFIEITPPAILQMPSNIKPIPTNIHYFWAGGEIPDKLVKNIATNAEKMPGFTSIVHVDADTPELLQAIKLKLDKNAPGVTVMNLHDEDFFQPLKNTELYTYFRRGQGKNLAATSDVARYPLMNKYGGIYLDTDDTIKGAVGTAGLNAGDSDMLVSKPVAHKITDYKPFFNTSNFATQPDNPVVTEMIAEMNRRFTKNKAYFEAHRPTLSREANGGLTYTEDFLEYEGKVFETVGPSMFDDVLKTKRPDIYDAGFDGMSKEKMQTRNNRFLPGEPFKLEDDTRQYYLDKGLAEPDGLKQSVAQAKAHYRALRDQLQINIGAEHSWINS
ncbi:glycosyltransferase [Pseudomonas salomonii]|uniref:Glycosyltransferase sugar-binding region containing DXD motif-containing protein n=1 Tax=Pseudomonas salomonii TaxID=191391 RepID=A0A1H3SM65_9PSED|nr:glycosyltransferase [Pseudomonas salomonii]SDZ38778.1 Glycosyltransferase sugar-binding region containing DXD motif-containing protein [Pseudomonas salomonii]